MNAAVDQIVFDKYPDFDKFTDEQPIDFALRLKKLGITFENWIVLRKIESNSGNSICR